MNCHKTMGFPCIVYKRKLLAFWGVMFLKNSMTGKPQCLTFLRPHGKNGVVGIRRITHDTEHKKEEPFVLMFRGMMLVFLAKHHGDQMKCSAWWR